MVRKFQVINSSINAVDSKKIPDATLCSFLIAELKSPTWQYFLSTLSECEAQQSTTE
jgi:hypothetical protein